MHPIVVIGMFRAGTTFLSQLFDQDDRNRALLRWEANDSVPPPSPANFRSGPRVDAAQLGNDMLEELNPPMKAIHHEDAAGATECITVMSQDFKSLSWEAITNVPTYSRWLLAADHRSAYEYHRSTLQVLQSGGVRGQWTLKSPHHAIALEALTAVYPDARLVLLHRDPVVLSASVCSLINTLSSTFSDADHRAYVAEHWTAMLEESVRRIDAFRAAHPEHPILDVQYTDLVQDPVGAVGRIYGAFDIELSRHRPRRGRRVRRCSPEGEARYAPLRPHGVRSRRSRALRSVLWLHRPLPGGGRAQRLRKLLGGSSMRKIRFITLVVTMAIVTAGITTVASAQGGSEKPTATEVGVTDKEIRIAVVADVENQFAPGHLPGLGERREGLGQVRQRERRPRRAQGRRRLHRLEAQRRRQLATP